MSDNCTCMEIFGEDPRCAMHGLETTWAAENVEGECWQESYLRRDFHRARLAELEAENEALRKQLATAREDALEEAARVAIHHSNYGHVEGNSRAFRIAYDPRDRAAAIRALKEKQ